ncbi:MAG TPA: CsbD family protein [Acidimicrobiales bacterium]
MSHRDKAHNSMKQAKGKAKEVAGAVTRNEQLETEGKVDQSTANLNQAGEKVKDAFKR